MLSARNQVNATLVIQKSFVVEHWGFPSSGKELYGLSIVFNLGIGGMLVIVKNKVLGGYLVLVLPLAVQFFHLYVMCNEEGNTSQQMK
jgi:hypothetical protein